MTKYFLHVSVDINDTFFGAADIDRYSNNNTALKTVIENQLKNTRNSHLSDGNNTAVKTVLESELPGK